MISNFGTPGNAYDRGYYDYIKEHISSDFGNLANILYIYDNQHQKSR